MMMARLMAAKAAAAAVARLATEQAGGNDIFMTPESYSKGGRHLREGECKESKSRRRSLALFRDASEVTKWPFRSERSPN